MFKDSKNQLQFKLLSMLWDSCQYPKYFPISFQYIEAAPKVTSPTLLYCTAVSEADVCSRGWNFHQYSIKFCSQVPGGSRGVVQKKSCHFTSWQGMWNGDKDGKLQIKEQSKITGEQSINSLLINRIASDTQLELFIFLPSENWI